MSEYALPKLDSIQSSLSLPAAGIPAFAKPGAVVKVFFMTASSGPNYKTATFKEFLDTYYPTRSAWASVPPASTDPAYGLYQNLTERFDICRKYNNLFSNNQIDPTDQAKALQNALQVWAKFNDLTIVQTTNPVEADVRIGLAPGMSGAGYCFYHKPDTGKAYRDIYLPGITGGFEPTSKSAVDLIHEFGHALGLQHPGKDDPPDHGSLDMAYTAFRYTNMSYGGGDGLFAIKARPIAPMLFDVIGMAALVSTVTDPDGVRCENGQAA